MAAPANAPPVEWVVSDRLVPYEEALSAMEAHVAAIAAGEAAERVWLLEHPPLYTSGTSAKADGVSMRDSPSSRPAAAGR